MGESIFDRIERWATERNITTAGTVEGQSIKLLEEIGEIFAGIARNDIIRVKDAVGDVLVIMTNIAVMDPMINNRPIDLTRRVPTYLLEQNTGTLAMGIASECATYFEQEAGGCADKDLKNVYNDVVDRLAVIASRYGFTLGEALEYVYAIISKRSGVFYNDVFIKEEDYTPELVENIIASGTVSHDAVVKLQAWLQAHA